MSMIDLDVKKRDYLIIVALDKGLKVGHILSHV